MFIVYSLFITFHGKRLLLAVYLSESYLHCCVTGVFAAAHDLKTEWVVVKGIKSYADSSQLANDEWGVFASVMAASVVSNILSNPIVFKEWPNYQGNNNTRSIARENLKVSVTTFISVKYLFPLFQWHACKLAELSACIAKCMTAIITFTI